MSSRAISVMVESGKLDGAVMCQICFPAMFPDEKASLVWRCSDVKAV